MSSAYVQVYLHYVSGQLNRYKTHCSALYNSCLVSLKHTWSINYSVYDPRYDNDALIRLPHSGMVNKQEEYDFLVPSRVRGLIAYMLCQALFSSANYYLHFFQPPVNIGSSKTAENANLCQGKSAAESFKNAPEFFKKRSAVVFFVNRRMQTKTIKRSRSRRKILEICWGWGNRPVERTQLINMW